MAKISRDTRKLDLTKLLNIYGNNIKEEVIKAIQKGAIAVEQDAKQNILSQNLIAKKPIKYKKGFPEGAPGKLLNSIHLEEHIKSKKPFVKVVSDAVNPVDGIPYGLIIEFSPKINKPFMGPALMKNKQQIIEDIKEAIKKGVKNSANNNS